MKRAVVIASFCFVILSTQLSRATPGIFQGRVYSPQGTNLPRGWIFIQSRNGMLRRVEVSRAQVVYGDSIPASKRIGRASKALVHGAEVRVTAEPDGKGEWRASKVEILNLAAEATVLSKYCKNYCFG